MYLGVPLAGYKLRPGGKRKLHSAMGLVIINK